MQKKNYVFLDFIEWDAKVWEKKNQLIREVPHHCLTSDAKKNQCFFRKFFEHFFSLFQLTVCCMLFSEMQGKCEKYFKR